jgi:hypothetical protein
VLSFDAGEMMAKLCRDGGRQHGHPILATLAVPHDELVRVEIDILDAQAGALEQAQARTVHQHGHQPGRAFESLEEGADLVAGEDDGEVLGRFARTTSSSHGRSRHST